MIRSVDGEIWRYQTIHGGSAVGRPTGTIGFGHFIFHDELHEFVREASLELEHVKTSDELTRYAGPGSHSIFGAAVVRFHIPVARAGSSEK